MYLDKRMLATENRLRYYMSSPVKKGLHIVADYLLHSSDDISGDSQALLFIQFNLFIV